MREFLSIDLSNFPIVVGKYQAFIPTLEEFVNAQSAIENFVSTRGNFVMVLDFSQMPVLAAEYRIFAAKWAERNNELFVRQKMNFVFYTPSILVKILMKSVFLISRPGIPYILTTSLDKGFAWANKKLGLNA